MIRALGQINLYIDNLYVYAIGGFLSTYPYKF